MQCGGNLKITFFKHLFLMFLKSNLDNLYIIIYKIILKIEKFISI